MNFAELITAARSFLPNFDYDRYPACFRQFEADAAPLFDALRGAEPEQTAASLIETLEKNRAAMRPRERKNAAEEEKRVLALFLAPAALRRGGDAAAFAEALMHSWNARYPRNTFLISGYDAIMKGFDANLLGLPLRKSRAKR